MKYLVSRGRQGRANTAAIISYNADHDTDVEIRQVKYLNHIAEQDHRAIKKIVRAMLGFEAFRSSAITIVGIEIMHMIWWSRRKAETDRSLWSDV